MGSIVLVAPSASALRKMLSICDNNTRNYSISFNASKSKRLVDLPSSRCSLCDYINNFTVFVGGKAIEYVDSFARLGHGISSQLSDSADIINRRNNFVDQVNCVFCSFSKMKPNVKCQLFHSYCMSIYGCELWTLSSDKISGLCISWRKSLRTHSMWINARCAVLYTTINVESVLAVV